VAEDAEEKEVKKRCWRVVRLATHNHTLNVSYTYPMLPPRTRVFYTFTRYNRTHALHAPHASHAPKFLFDAPSRGHHTYLNSCLTHVVTLSSTCGGADRMQRKKEAKKGRLTQLGSISVSHTPYMNTSLFVEHKYIYASCAPGALSN
jgi:hypothetical protein